MAAGSDPERITEAEVAAFTQKLEEWGKQLPEGEQALLRMLVAASEGATPDDVAGYAFNLSIGRAASASLMGLRRGGLGAIGWTKMGGPSEWVRSDPPLHLP